MATHPNSRHKLPKLAPATHRASSQTRGTEGLGKRKATEIVPLFAQHYMGDCRHNATAAAIAIGANPRSAHSTGYHLLKKARESGLLAKEARKVAENVELTTEGALRQVARILHADPARLFDEHGNAIPIHLLDENTRAAIASFEYDEYGRPKVKFWSKVEAANIAMKHFGLFERDNRQQLAPNLAIQVNLVQAPVAKPNGAANGANGAGVHVNLVEKTPSR
jgi:Terminase small subunit